MLSRIQIEVNKRLFDGAVKKILDTPPIARKDADIVFFSMLQSSDVLPYLLAVKSIYHGVGQGRVAILNDGSLTESDLHTLKAHLVDPEIFHINEVDTGDCPTGGCWERLVKLIEMTKHDYVVQVDADLVCTGPIEKVTKLWKQGSSFALGNISCPGLVTFEEMSRWTAEIGMSDHKHVQSHVESGMKDLPNAATRRYVRATAAFAGFPKGGFDLKDLEAFSNDCRDLYGERWNEWGTEQISSNYLIANSNDPHLLKPPTYINNVPQLDPEAAELIHFYGSHRFDSSRYKRAAEKMIPLL